jgi:hypothetical protein
MGQFKEPSRKSKASQGLLRLTSAPTFAKKNKAEVSVEKLLRKKFGFPPLMQKDFGEATGEGKILKEKTKLKLILGLIFIPYL